MSKREFVSDAWHGGPPHGNVENCQFVKDVEALGIVNLFSWGHSTWECRDLLVCQRCRDVRHC